MKKVLIFGVLIALVTVVILNRTNNTKNLLEEQKNIIIQGKLDKKTVFVNNNKFIKVIILDNKVESQTIKDLSKSEIGSMNQDRVVFEREGGELTATSAFLDKDKLYISLDGDDKNIIIRVDTKNGTSEIIHESDNVNALTVQKIINNKYIVGYYEGFVPSNKYGNSTIINMETKKEMVISAKDRGSSEPNIIIDVNQNIVRYNKSEKYEVKCLNNPKFSSGCNGYYFEKGRYFEYRTTDKIAETSLSI